MPLSIGAHKPPALPPEVPELPWEHRYVNLARLVPFPNECPQSMQHAVKGWHRMRNCNITWQREEPDTCQNPAENDNFSPASRPFDMRNEAA